MKTAKFDNTKLTDEELAALPGDPFIFDTGIEGSAQFQEGEEDKKTFRLQLFDGSISEHWFWGNLTFDLDTLKTAKAKIPFLFAHNTDQRLGMGKKVAAEGKFVMEGKPLQNDFASQIIDEMGQGFPFEASLRFDPARTKIERVSEGETVEVNGRKLKGPGTIMRNATVIEGSICVFGALKNCKSEAFKYLQEQAAEASADNDLENSQEKEIQMSEKKTTDAAVDEKAVRLEERTRIADIFKSLPGEGLAEIRNKAVEGGFSLIEAKAEAFELLVTSHAAEMKEVNEKLVAADERLKILAKAGFKSEDFGAGSNSEDTDEQNESRLSDSEKIDTSEDDGKAATYSAKVDELVAAGKTKGAAFKLAAKKLPKSQRAWKLSQPAANERE